ncbi:hypothetical protein ACU61A_41005 [Pseudonocardia sichuanensis]
MSRYRYRPPTRPCVTQRRYPHLHLAEAAAAASSDAQRPSLCRGCGGFHLVPPPLISVRVQTRAGGGS